MKYYILQYRYADCPEDPEDQFVTLDDTPVYSFRHIRRKMKHAILRQRDSWIADGMKSNQIQIKMDSDHSAFATLYDREDNLPGAVLEVEILSCYAAK